MSDDDFVAALESSLKSRSDETSVRHVRSGDDACAELDTDASAIDCLVVASSPERDDAMFVRNLRERGFDVPVVVAVTDERAAREYLDAGATDYAVCDGADAAARTAGRVERVLSERGDTRVTHPDRRDSLFAVVDRTDDAIVALDADWRVTYANPAARDSLGISTTEESTRRIWDVPQSSAFREEFETAMETGEPTRFEARYDPLESWYAVEAYPESAGLVARIGDITDRKRQQATAERDSRMIETAADALYTLDAEGQFTAVNPAFERLTGRAETQVIGSPAEHILGPDSATDSNNGATGGDDGAVDATATQLVEFELKTADGPTVRVENHRTPIVEDGDVIGSVGVLRDVTHRHRSERLLSTLHERTRELMSAPDRDTVLAVAVDTCDEIFDGARTEVFAFDEGRHALTRLGGVGADAGEPSTERPDSGGVWEAFASGEVRVIDTGEGVADDSVDGGRERRRSIAAPFGRHGVLVTGSQTAVSPTDVDIELVSLLSATVEDVLDRIAAESEVRSKNGTSQTGTKR
ncbi:PAS domain S-box protein [Haloferax mucosum]|uniref:PAS domain S-box protein n=1 Tax=Haloferax mucosum TaxID=403181 RepID=UPI003084668E